MSSEALSWAFKQTCKSASVKFTLVALCECANYKTGRITPSIAYITEITGQNRKTIIANIAELERAGLIEDTGERVGRTGQIKVYQAALGVEGSRKSEVHYLYRLTQPETGEFYIGVRSFLGDPESDGYKGSGVWPTGAAYKGVALHKEVVATFKTRSEAECAEAEAIAKVIGLPLCRNRKEESHKRDTIPKTGPLKSTEKAPKQSQKRDTEPSREPSSPNGDKKRAPAIACPPDVNEQVWKDFQSVRKAKGAPVTETALAGIKREADKAGWTLNEALTECATQGWQGFKAKWVMTDDRAKPKPASNDEIQNPYARIAARRQAERASAGHR